MPKFLSAVKGWIVANKLASVGIGAGAAAIIATSIAVPVAVANRKVAITWKNEDGTVLVVTDVRRGNMPEFTGETPTKAETAQYSYSFVGWEPEVVKADKATTYTAKFSSEVRKYTVTWKNYDGTELEKDENVPYGTMPSYDGADPTKESSTSEVYSFDSWDKEVVQVTGDAIYTATFSPSTRKYTITWVDDDDSPIGSAEVDYGTMPTPPANPSKAATAEWSYAFDKWTPEIAEVSGDQTYKATYTASKQKYTVRWFAEGGEDVLETDTDVEYGTAPSFDKADPTKAKTEEVTYTFDGWVSGSAEAALEKDLPVVTGNVDYVAHFASAPTKYTVKFLNTAGDAVIHTIENVDYGADVRDQFEGDLPTKSSAYMEIAFDEWEEQEIDTTNYIRTYKPTFRDVVSKDSCFGFIDEGTYYTLYSVSEVYDYPTLILPSTYNSKPVKNVYTSCFYNKLSNNVKKIIIPDSYNNLQSQSFCWSPAEEIIIEGSPACGQSLFHSSSKLKHVEFKGTKPYTIQRAMFESCRPSNGFEVVFSEGLTSIPESCFRNSYIKNVNIPDSATSIGESAFTGCSKLESIDFGDSPSFTSIGASAFNNTESLKEFSIPETVVSLGESCFYGSGIEEIVVPDSVTTIGASLFRNSKVKNITLGAHVTPYDVYSNYIIQNCPIEEFAVSENSDSLSVVDGYLFDYAGEQLVRCPAAMEGEITLPTKTKSIAQYAFEGTKNLNKVIINEGVTKIPQECFANSSVTEVVMSSTVTSIDAYAFKNSSLEKITIGKNVSSIDNLAFSDCATITEVTVDSESSYFVCEDLVLFNKAKTTLKLCVKCKTGSYAIPNTVETVANSAFLGCELDVTVPDSVTYFGDYSFKEFKGSVTLGKGITQIFPNMFTKADIETIVLPTTVKTINNSAFDGSKIETISLNDACTTIGTMAFRNCSSLTEINLNKVQTIGSYAFTGCTSLEDVTIPETAVACDSWAFKQSGVVNVTWNGGDVPDYCFDSCDKLTTVTFSNKNKDIGKYAFYFCMKLESVTFSSSLEYIHQSAFYYCSPLDSISLPASLKSIELNAFVSIAATEIDYAGTKSDWESVSKAAGWKGSALKTVNCTDGPLDL